MHVVWASILPQQVEHGSAQGSFLLQWKRLKLSPHGRDGRAAFSSGERCYQPTTQPMVASQRPAHANTPMILSAVSRGLRL